MQAHVRDKANQRRIFVRDGEGSWIERPDLARDVRAGRIPSADPGLVRGPGGTATFAIATLKDGGLEIDVPEVSQFDHNPRARPFQVGDTVQIMESTGQLEDRTEGLPHVFSERVRFGRIQSTNGRGSWGVSPLDAGGNVETDAAGQPVVRHLFDQDLRRINNPNLLRAGDVIEDATFDPEIASHKTMIADWRSSKEHRRLSASRPGPNASSAERARWERNAIEAADAWIHDRMRYPGTSDRDRQGWRDRIADIDRSLAEPALAADARQELETERQQLQGELDWSERDFRTRDRLSARVGELEKQIAAAKPEERQRLEEELGEVRGERDRISQTIDADAKYYDELEEQVPPRPIGDFYANRTGVCRHQGMALQTLLQEVGVDSRLTRGAANTEGNIYRGDHLWLEASLSDGSHLMVDPTWTPGDPISDLQRTYENRNSRREVPLDTIRDYSGSVVQNPNRAIPA
jgi:hypothetical protein